MQSYDLVIIGAGPAGMSAALAAENRNLRILLVDDNPAVGGQIWRQGVGAHLSAAARELIAKVMASTAIEVASGTRVVMFPGADELLLENSQQGWQVRYEKLILCTGARERLLPFPGWTLPGVTGAGALQALIKGGVPVKGERVVFSGSGPLLLAGAETARAAGAEVVAIFEQASFGQVGAFAIQLARWPGKAVQALKMPAKGYRTNAYVTEVFGESKVEGVRVRQGEKVREIACDRLACGFGLVPNLQLAQGRGCTIAEGRVAVDSFQRTSCDNVYAAGEATGFGGSELALVEGEIAGLHAAGDDTAARALFSRRQHWQGFAKVLACSFVLRSEVSRLSDNKTLLCRCEDVSYDSLLGLSGWTEAKRATRCGMGACQGRICGTAAEAVFGWQPPVPRPPFTPVRANTLTELPDRS